MPKGVYYRSPELCAKMYLNFKGRGVKFKKGNKLYLKNIGIPRPDVKNLPQTWKKGHIPWHTGKGNPKIRGELHPNWKGGITPINLKIRMGLDYKIWRHAVFTRDNFTCVNCGQVGGALHADHIKMFAFHPELRFAIDNGRTLCKKCHMAQLTTKNRKHICCEK